MTIFILAPDPANCHPFYVAQQLETAAWAHGATETEARARMMEHRKYRPEVEVVISPSSKTLSDVPIGQTTCSCAHELDPIIPIGVPYKEENPLAAIVEPHRGIDPLAYHFALAWVEEISAHLKRPAGYYRVSGKQYGTLEGVVRAIAGGEPVIERGEVVRRRQYPRPKKKAAGKRKKGEVTQQALDQMVELSRRLMAEEMSEQVAH